MSQTPTTNTTVPASAEPHWSRLREAGTLLGMRFLLWTYRLFGRPVYSLLMYPVALYFLITRPTARRASLQYLRRHQRCWPDYWGSMPHYGHVLMHFKAFAEVILDKLLGWVIEIDANEFYIKDQSTVDELMQDSRGQLIIGSHFGNLEYCRGFMQRYRDKVITIMVHDKHSANFIALMQQLNPASRLNVLQVDEFDITTIADLQHRIANGEWVFIAGDRTPLTGVARTTSTLFLGAQAPFPIGPYIIAQALACPVKLMFAYRLSEQSCARVYFEVLPFAEKIDLPRQGRQELIRDHVQRFADTLQSHCRRAPYQWFNFYDFWPENPPE